MILFDFNWTLIELVVNACLVAHVVAIGLCFFRLLRGPSLPDRVLSLELISITVIGFIAIYTIHTEDPVLLDVGIVLGLIAFLGTVAFALYVERGTDQ